MIFYLGFLALIAILRLLELRISKRNWERHRLRARRLEEPLFFWMVLLHSSLFVLLPIELFVRRPGFGGWISGLAVVGTAFALVLRGWTLKTIGRSWNVRVIGGKDYPIVSHGPYRFIRHPNYLVVMMELAFIPLVYHLYWSTVILSVLNILVLRRRILDEEKVLFENPEWVARMSKKPRFFPGF